MSSSSLPDPMEKPDRDSPPAAALSDRLAAAESKSRKEGYLEARRPLLEGTMFALPVQIISDLIGGLATGAGTGWLLDRWTGWHGAFLGIFSLMGFAAGMINIWRTLKKADKD